MRLIRDWWRVDPGGLAMLVGLSFAVLLAALTATLIAKV